VNAQFGRFDPEAGQRPEGQHLPGPLHHPRDPDPAPPSP
jgi:hypothetical protein